MAEKETVTSATVLAEIGKTNVEPTFVQRAGLRLALGVGAAIAIVTFSLVGFLFAHYPSAPSADVVATASDAKTVLENYKVLADVAVKNAVELFHTIVTQALLPVFTAILGFIFAKGDRDSR